MKPKRDRLDLEEICRKVFDDRLRNEQTPRNIEWERYPNGQNSPPDFNVVVDDKLLSVEVTGLTRIKKDSENRVDAATYEISRLRFADRLTQKALELGILKGCYTIHFNMNWLVPLNKKIRGHIEKQAFDYIQKSKDKESELDIDIRYELKRVCQISKINVHKDRIFATFTDAEWSDSPEVILSARDMVQRAVFKKASKLQKGNIPQPWVLLLYNANPFASEDTFKKCEDQESIERKELFNRIFIVTSLDSGFDFYLNISSVPTLKTKNPPLRT